MTDFVRFNDIEFEFWDAPIWFLENDCFFTFAKGRMTVLRWRRFLLMTLGALRLRLYLLSS